MPSTIEWTEETLNFVTGCTKVSPGCKNCYMHRLWPRLHGMNVPGYGGQPNEVYTRLATNRLNQIDTWRRPLRIFINSMSDTFHDEVPFEDVRLMLEKARNNPRHTLLVLTKRPSRAVAFWKWQKCQGWTEWPANVHLGVSVESAEYLWRLDEIAQVPAKIRFASFEPLLENLGDLRPWLLGSDDRTGTADDGGCLSWVVLGGESGPGARPMHPQWARDVRDQCQEAGVPFFFKQWGEYVATSQYPDGEQGRRAAERTWKGSRYIFPDGLGPLSTGQQVFRVGKKAAGALLDGKQWKEMPDG